MRTIQAATITLSLALAGTTGAYAQSISNETIGGLLGAVVGGVAGSQIGGGSGNTAATIAGTVIGGVAGSKIAETYTPDQPTYATPAPNYTAPAPAYGTTSSATYAYPSMSTTTYTTTPTVQPYTAQPY